MPNRPTQIAFSQWHLDIDRYLIPFLPAPPRWLPRPVSYMLGYREKKSTKVLGNIPVALWSLLNVFCSLALVGAVTRRVPSFRHHDAPAIIGSFGAAAVLQLCAIESPLAQPRNAIFGQIFGCAIGVGVCKLFALNQNAQSFPELAGALACAITTAVMVLTDTVHPPAGATALVAVVSAPQLGWFLFPVVLLSTVLMLCAAVLLNNIQRRYPMYWWTPHNIAHQKPTDVEKRIPENEAPDKECCDFPPRSGNTSTSTSSSCVNDPPLLVIRRGRVLVSKDVFLTEVERDQNFDECKQAVENMAVQQNFVVVIRRSLKRDRTAGDSLRYELACTKGSQFISEGKGLRQTSSGCGGCPWQGYIAFYKRERAWRFSLQKDRHNHPAMNANIIATTRRRKRTENEEVIGRIRHGLQNKHPKLTTQDFATAISEELDIEVEAKDVQNVKDESRRVALEGRTPTQNFLLELQNDQRAIVDYQTDAYGSVE